MKNKAYRFLISPVILPVILLVIAISIAACTSQEPEKNISKKPEKFISKELEIDVSGGKVLTYTDSHGGCLGDGQTFVALEYSDDKILNQIKEKSEWKAFPLDYTVKALVYGISDGKSCIGPYIYVEKGEEKGKALVPDIQNGYYLLIDRQEEAYKEKDILHRYSFNFSLGIFDSDSNTLYFCALDT